ncbi:MAG: PilW family protein [Rhodoferax sp.]|nr:PilW family protein [Rhodoferax sp.]
MRDTNTMQKGFTLIELMVSLAIGLVVSLAAVTAYSTAQRAGAISEVQSRMNEDAQMALSILAQHARLAGSNPARPDRLTPPASNLRNTLANPYMVRGCNTTFSNIKAATSAALLTCFHIANSTKSNSLSLGYEADSLNTITTATGVPTDCMGSALAARSATIIKADGSTTTIAVYEAENRFYIGTSANNANPTLYCKGNATSAQPLVENTEDLQITYGVFNPAAATKEIVGYLDAYQLENDTSALTGLDQAARWRAVGAIRFCIVMRSAETVSLGTGKSQYVNCAGDLVTSPDLRLRRAYGITIALRNNL